MYKNASLGFNNNNMKALFLDRDGVINVDYGYVCEESNFIFVEGIFDLCRLGVSKGYKIFVITNQSGIARGYYSEEDFIGINKWMLKIFKQNHVDITETYYCPSHPIHGQGYYKKEDECRKPRPGMILKAQREHKINLEESVLIGDNITDIQAGEAAGVKYNLLFTQKDPETSNDTLTIRTLNEAYVYLSK